MGTPDSATPQHRTAEEASVVALRELSPWRDDDLPIGAWAVVAGSFLSALRAIGWDVTKQVPPSQGSVAEHLGRLRIEELRGMAASTAANHVRLPGVNLAMPDGRGYVWVALPAHELLAMLDELRP